MTFKDPKKQLNKYDYNIKIFPTAYNKKFPLAREIVQEMEIFFDFMLKLPNAIGQIVRENNDF